MEKENIMPWGKYAVIEKTRIVNIKPYSKLSLQYHENKEEFWRIISGKGKVIKGNKKFDAKPGDTFMIKKRETHSIETEDSEITFIEIATGEIDEQDIIRIKDEYGRETNQEKNKKIVVASGYFDPIHIGHIEYLKIAKQQGDRLIVILNNDEQAILKKGKPFMPLEERKEILESLSFVDEVIISIDKDPSVRESIRYLAKNRGVNIFAKGGDRFSHEIPESKVCKEFGIKIVDGLGKKIQSSSSLTGIKEIK